MKPPKNHSRFPLFSGLRPVVALVLSVCVLLSGCVSLHSVPPPVPGQPQTVSVKVGDKVEVQTKGGERLAFTVTAVESEAFVGKALAAGSEIRVRYQDIATLQVRRVDKVPTIVAVVLCLVVVAGVAVAASGGIMGGGGASYGW